MPTAAESQSNRIRFGLSYAEVPVRPEQRAEFESLARALSAEYAPATQTEQTFALEALHATWRLRTVARAKLQFEPNLDLDAAPDSESARDQALDRLDRLRAQAANSLRRSLKELRQLQTERRLRAELNIPREVQATLGLADSARILAALAKTAKRTQPAPSAPPQKEPGFNFDEFLSVLDETMPDSIKQYFTNRSDFAAAPPPRSHAEAATRRC